MGSRTGRTSTSSECRSILPSIWFADVDPRADRSYRVAFKSPATISQAQETAQYDGTAGVLAARGRHDPCVVPRAVPIVEAMASLVIMDQVLIQNARKTAASLLPPITTLPPTMVKPAASA